VVCVEAEDVAADDLDALSSPQTAYARTIVDTV
jgi:hypothetical protein